MRAPRGVHLIRLEAVLALEQLIDLRFGDFFLVNLGDDLVGAGMVSLRARYQGDDAEESAARISRDRLPRIDVGAEAGDFMSVEGPSSWVAHGTGKGRASAPSLTSPVAIQSRKLP